MIVVKYYASGMKVNLGETDMSGFWALFRRLRRACENDDPDQTYVYRTGGASFELVDERRADGCTQFVVRPDDWPIDCGEPA